jgi:hypothetical protein
MLTRRVDGVANRLRFGCESQDTRRCLLFPIISYCCLLLPALLAIAFTVAWRSLGKLLSTYIRSVLTPIVLLK